MSSQKVFKIIYATSFVAVLLVFQALLNSRIQRLLKLYRLLKQGFLADLLNTYPARLANRHLQ